MKEFYPQKSEPEIVKNDRKLFSVHSGHSSIRDQSPIKSRLPLDKLSESHKRTELQACEDDLSAEEEDDEEEEET